jgi:hypothetical protein
MKIKIVTHFPSDDPDCMGDYDHVTVEKLEKKSEVIAWFGDYYHDKGDVAAKAFVQGLEWALENEVEITYEKVADAEAWG